MSAIGAANHMEPDKLSCRKTPITPEDLEAYIDRRIEIKGRIVVKGKDLIAVVDK